MKWMKFFLLITIGMFSNCTYSQQNQNSKMTNQTIVETFLNGFNDPAKIPASLALLADDYKFKNPMVELNSKTEFIALLTKIGTVLTGLEIITTAENGNWVAAYYVFKSSIPGIETNLATEWFRIENGIIKESHMIYDASKWRKVYEQMEE